MEQDEVRFGLNYGLEPNLDRVNRWATLCSVAMLREETSVFEDLRAQPCDLINPALVHRLNLGFYAGTALRTQEGYPIGVLCVIDHQARTFSREEAHLLERLAAVVMSLLDLRLHLLQQPTWNQQLWASIYTRIDQSVTRLETLTSLAGWEETAASEAPQAYRRSTQEEALGISAVLAEQIRGRQLSL